MKDMDNQQYTQYIQEQIAQGGETIACVVDTACAACEPTVFVFSNTDQVGGAHTFVFRNATQPNTFCDAFQSLQFLQDMGDAQYNMGVTPKQVLLALCRHTEKLQMANPTKKGQLRLAALQKALTTYNE